MNYLFFNGALLLAAIVALIFYYTGLMLLLAPLMLFKRADVSPRTITFPIWTLTGIYQVVFWGLWAALCVALIMKFIQVPGVHQQWLYWFTGFVGCLLLIGLITYENFRSGRSIAGIRGIQNGATLIALVAIAAFSAFSYKPSYGIRTYGFALKPLGLHKYLVSHAIPHPEPKSGTEQAGRDKALNTILNFYEGYDYIVRANKTISFAKSHKPTLHELEIATQLLVESKERLSGCDTDLLNRIYSRWGDLVAHNLIPSIDLQLSGMGLTKDMDAISKAYLLMAEFDGWLGKHRRHITCILNDSYGL